MLARAGAAQAAMLALRTAALLLAMIWAGQPAVAAADTHVSEWSALDVKAWLSDTLKLPAVAAEAERDRVDGPAARTMDKQDWRDLGASGLKAAKIVGSMKSLMDTPPSSSPSPRAPSPETGAPLCQSSLATRTTSALTTVGDGSRTQPLELPAALVGGVPESCSAGGAARADNISVPTDPAEALHFFLALRNASLSHDWQFVARGHAMLQRRCAAATISRAQLEASLEDGLLLLQVCGFVRVDGGFPQSRRVLRRKKPAADGGLDLSKLGC
jgi:hypothetical protein